MYVHADPGKTAFRITSNFVVNINYKSGHGPILLLTFSSGEVPHQLNDEGGVDGDQVVVASMRGRGKEELREPCMGGPRSWYEGS